MWFRLFEDAKISVFFHRRAHICRKKLMNLHESICGKDFIRYFAVH